MVSAVTTTQPLYRGQQAAQNVFKTDWFSRYSTEYIQSQQGFKKGAVQCYNHVYDALSFLGRGAAAVISVAGSAFGWAALPLKGIRDVVFPINPINGERRFAGIPRGAEKFLGDSVFHPLHTFSLRETHELVPGTQESMGQRVQSILQRLCESNAELLNPSKEKTKFNYRVQTVYSPDCNAFALPGGGMVVYSQLVKELHGAITSRQIKESRITFADGSHATVDLTNVTLDDALASLMGHEMTHVASRHWMASLVINIAHTILANVGRILCIHYLQSLDKEYQQLKQRPLRDLTPSDRSKLQNKEAQYDRINGFFKWAQDKLSFLDRMFQSRKNEYEADVTGAYFAHQAHLNPLGAIFLQEYFTQKNGLSFLHKHLEFLFTHPYGENRKRALFASIAEFAPQNLRGRVSNWHFADNSAYDQSRLSPGYRFSREAASALG